MGCIDHVSPQPCLLVAELWSPLALNKPNYVQLSEPAGHQQSTAFKGSTIMHGCGHTGCYAEYVAVAEGQVAVMPADISFAAAAATPTGALTAWQVSSPTPLLALLAPALSHPTSWHPRHRPSAQLISCS